MCVCVGGALVCLCRASSVQLLEDDRKASVGLNVSVPIWRTFADTFVPKIDLRIETRYAAVSVGFSNGNLVQKYFCE